MLLVLGLGVDQLDGVQWKLNYSLRSFVLALLIDVHGQRSSHTHRRWSRRYK